MAGASEKKRSQRNSQKLSFLLKLLLGSAFLYLSGRGLRVAAFGHALTKTSIALFIGSIALQALLYFQLSGIADAGGDLYLKGSSASYVLDVFYIAVIALAGGVVSDRAWMTYLVIPVAVTVWLGSKILPFLFAARSAMGGGGGGEGGSAPGESSEDKKRQDKTERRKEARRRKWA